MSSIRIKNKPGKSQSDNRTTIDVIHVNVINTITKNNKDLNNLKSKLEIENNKNNKNLKKIYELTFKINEIKKKNIDEDEYYLNTGFLLDEYYSNRNENNKTETVLNKGENNENNIINWFNNSKPEIEQGLEPEPELDNKNIINQYISYMDDNKINSNIYDINHDINICINCNQNSMRFKNKDSEIYCIICGNTETILIHTDKASFKDVPKEITYFAYKRINHFNEWLAQIQAKETTSISMEIYNNILIELKKDINIDKKNISHQKIREILKKLNYNKYYEHIPHFINVLTGKKTVEFIGNYEDKLRNMFKEIQIPFSKYCPEKRKNFLSYSYVLHKFCQLLELDDLLIYFPLLKSREKLKNQDIIWKNICNDLKWEFIPSI
tara:strand:- start:767 stop:1912 length:1146 start_codon:yes stop_codon:yes gene_type:complete